MKRTVTNRESSDSHRFGLKAASGWLERVHRAAPAPDSAADLDVVPSETHPVNVVLCSTMEPRQATGQEE